MDPSSIAQFSAQIKQLERDERKSISRINSSQRINEADNIEFNKKAHLSKSPCRRSWSRYFPSDALPAMMDSNLQFEIEPSEVTQLKSGNIRSPRITTPKRSSSATSVRSSSAVKSAQPISMYNIKPEEKTETDHSAQSELPMGIAMLMDHMSEKERKKIAPETAVLSELTKSEETLEAKKFNKSKLTQYSKKNLDAIKGELRGVSLQISLPFRQANR